jgi:hypothetical protein
MKVIGPITEVYGALRPTLRRRVEKPNGSSGLGQEMRSARRAIMLNPVARDEPRPSRFDTASGVRECDHAMLAPFVAQIIGQVLDTKRADPASAMRAYAAASMPAPEFIRAL